MAAPGQVFVGRHQEMAGLQGALEDALSGQGRLVMLVGEPGIGKTRTAQELAVYAERQGTQVLWGRCYEGEGAPPYWPWTQPLRSYIQYSAPETLESELGTRASDIAEVVPEVREKLQDLQPPPSLEPEAARFRLFDSISFFLKNASQNQPLMLVLDNLHWADRSSLMLLEFVAREIGDFHLLILGTFRDVDVSRRHPLSETLGRLVRERVFSRMQLEGLSQQEVGNLLETTSGGRPAPDVVETVHIRTEGNPLFVDQIGQLMTSSSPQEAGGWSGELPEAIRDAIGERLGRLSDGCNRALAVASVIGREFDFELLGRVADVSDDELLGLIEEALEAHVIEDLPGAQERYQFSHALIQETLNHELSSSRRVRLHARIGETLEALHFDNLEAQASALAYHFAQSQRLTGAEKLVRYSLIAGEQALAAHAWEEALAHFQRAIAGKEGQPMDGETATILLDLGQAQSSMDEWEDALVCLDRALEYFVEVGDSAKATAVALCSLPHEAYSQQAQFIARTLELVPPDSHKAGRLLSRYGTLLGWEYGDYEGAEHALDQALAIARREQDRFLEMWTLERGSALDRNQLLWDKSLNKALEAIELAPHTDNLQAEILAFHHAASALMHTGNLQEADYYASSGLAPAERLREIWRLSATRWMIEIIASLRGDWQTARDLSDRTLEGASRSVYDTSRLSTRVLWEHQLGNFDEAERYMQQMLDELPSTLRQEWFYLQPAVVITLVGQITGVTDHFDVAETIIQDTLSQPHISPSQMMVSRVALGLRAVQEDDTATALKQYQSLKSLPRTIVPYGLMISLHRVLGLLAHSIGRHDDAVLHFEEGIAFCRNAGYRPELAWTCHDYAAMITGSSLKPASTDAHEKVMSLLEEALAISTELGMKPLMDKAFALKEQALASPVKSASYPDGLTDREVEVLRLIAAGMTDRQIADDLVISVRTVGNHVVSILNKTTTANRTEAAIYATRNNLL